jgi:hypothetical protein
MLPDYGANGSVGVVDKFGKEKADDSLSFSGADDPPLPSPLSCSTVPLPSHNSTNTFSPPIVCAFAAQSSAKCTWLA